MTFFLLLGVGQVTHAQTRGFIEGGLALPKIAISLKEGGDSMSSSVDLKTTFYLGAGVNLKLSQNLYTDASLQWSLLGVKGMNESSSYFRLPVALMYQISDALPLQVGAGGYLGLLAEEGAPLDYGVVFKARYSFVKNFFLQASYHLGLKDHAGVHINDSQFDNLSVSSKLNGFQLGVGFAF